MANCFYVVPEVRFKAVYSLHYDKDCVDSNFTVPSKKIKGWGVVLKKENTFFLLSVYPDRFSAIQFMNKIGSYGSGLNLQLSEVYGNE